MKRNGFAYLVIPITINIVIILMEIGSTISCINRTGLKGFIFYTLISNMFATITSAFIIYYLIQKYRNNNPIPELLIIFKLLSTCCLGLTFLVVIFVLSWSVKEMTPIELIFWDSSLVHHLLGPIFSIVSYILWEVDHTLPYKYSFLCLIPTALYGVVLIPLNIAHIISGPYPFLKVTEQSVGMTLLWLTIIFTINLLTAVGIIFLNNYFGLKIMNLLINKPNVDISEPTSKTDSELGYYYL